MKLNKTSRDWLHYAVVFSAILFTWVPIMNVMGESIGAFPIKTALASFFVFYAADKLAHRFIIRERI